MYTNTVTDNPSDEIIEECLKISSMSIFTCLSYLDEKSVYKVYNLMCNSYIGVEHHCFWYLNLSCYSTKQPTESIPIPKDISDPLYLVQALSQLLSTHKITNHETQLEQDYIICLYFYFCFKQIEKLFKNKAVSKIKINNTLSSEMNDVLKIAVNLRKQIGDGNDENDGALRQVKSDRFDYMIEELIYIVVNLSETPSKYAEYFTQSVIFSLESKGLSIIKHFITIIKEIDEDVLVKLIDLCFREEKGKYQIFSILFKLLRQSEENEIHKIDNNVVTRALILALYKSNSTEENLVVLSKLFFMMFLPYAFGEKNQELSKRIENEIQDLDAETFELEAKVICNII